jgi:hypothetical protein
LLSPEVKSRQRIRGKKEARTEAIWITIKTIAVLADVVLPAASFADTGRSPPTY